MLFGSVGDRGEIGPRPVPGRSGYECASAFKLFEPCVGFNPLRAGTSRGPRVAVLLRWALALFNRARPLTPPVAAAGNRGLACRTSRPSRWRQPRWR